MEVNGVGTLSFPIPDSQIQALVRAATQAPYGRGEETIVDTSVRNVWQITPSGVKISGKSWAANFDHILSKVTAGLGCQNALVAAKLYKLLVYDRGGFFLAHRDTEKTAGMFGTLVVTLPSPHRGGALRLRHSGREVTVKSDASEPSEISFVAFYADCEHELLPVRHGNRVCLIYNLLQQRTKTSQHILKVPNYEHHIAEAATILEEFWLSAGSPPKIAWLLDHHYSPAGLSFSLLKGADAGRARVLAQAAARARCVVHLGVVHIGQTGSAEDDGGYHGFRGDEEHEESEDEDSTASMVDDSWQYVDEWRDTGDRAVDFGRIPLTPGELLPAGSLDKEPPDEKRLTEASGNEGATYEWSYHRAALVIWPANRMMDVLLEGGVAAAVPYLQRLAQTGERTRTEAMAAAQRVVEAWSAADLPSNRYSMGAIASPGASDRARMISALVELNAPPLLEQFVRDAVISAYNGIENAALVASTRVLGSARAARILSALADARMGDQPCGCVELLPKLAAEPVPSFGKIAAAVVAGLESIQVPKNLETDALWQLRAITAKLEPKRDFAPEFLRNLFSALRPFKQQLSYAAAETIGSRPDVFAPTTLVVPSIGRLFAERGDDDRAIQHLWTCAAQFLLLRSEVPPQPPPDWRLQAKFPCRCADCRELQAFVRNPTEKVHRFRVNKERRRHLHQVIDRHRLDMTHVTERVGSPQTLICTKDRRTFDSRMKEYQSEIAAMQRLVTLAPPTATAGGLCKRMEAAVKASG
ncbi:2OG-Fe(II) oxygenase [Paludibaculum fermentans]|uniref:2OG-Fe(II) oxygenase n=1 Tax=Paludibaculum fermentans TaxID=1473598 RepID=UPI003EBA6611